MTENPRIKKRPDRLLASLFGLLFIILGGCDSQTEPYTIGMVNDVSIREPAWDGFKTGMTELGHIEGRNIHYMYNGPTGSQEVSIDTEINKMVSQGVDMLVVFGNAVAFRAKTHLEETGIPIIGVALGSPVEAGLVESLSHPGGNLTGLQIFDTTYKGLEWLKLILPQARRVFLPYDAGDKYVGPFLENLKKNAAQIGLEIVIHPVHTADETAAAIESLPEDIDAIYRIAAPNIDPENIKLSEAAIRRGLPSISSISLDEKVLLTCATPIFELGRQAARLASQVLKGQRPEDLPVETAEVTVTINLLTAERIGLTIPDIVLVQATEIIR
jgi:putative ABC transport system substrate-binding protein